MKRLTIYSKAACLVLLALAFSDSSKAQELEINSNEYPSRKNAAFFELGGNAGRYSFNYQRVLLEGKRTQFEGRIGASYWRPDGINYLVVIAEAVLVRGSNRNKMEIGAGAAHGMGGRGMIAGFETFARDQTHPTFRVGYRRELPKEFFFKVSGMMFLGVSLPWVGLAIGKHF